MPNCKNGKIFKIINRNNNEEIIDCSTKNRPCQILNEYKKKYGNDNMIIEIIENYPCNSMDELIIRKNEYKLRENEKKRNDAKIKAILKMREEKLKTLLNR